MDKPTDVLSFAQDTPGLLGDIVISVETAFRQAQSAAWPKESELCLLSVHGMLHLLGYDDETDHGAQEMEQLTRSLLLQSGIALPEAEHPFFQKPSVRLVFCCSHMPSALRPKSQIDSFRYAIEGIIHVFRTQKHMRFHFLVVVLVLVIGLLFRFSGTQMIDLILAMAGVLVAEMVNTAVETTVDLVTQTYHPLAKLAKDIAAGAVLLMAMTAGLVGFILFFGTRKIAPLTLAVRADPQPLMVLAVLVAVLFVVVMIVKVIGGKGTILSGGIVSGHAAISFFLAVTLIYRSSMDPVSVVLALLLAILVVQSRVEGKIHTIQEVVLGGLLGVGVTAGIYYFSVVTH